MRKEMFVNVLNGSGCTTSSDFSAEDKKKIFAVMEEKGMSSGSAYNRFFRDGFSRWEVLGIETVLTQYVLENNLDPSLLDDFSTFYAKLDRKTAFKQHMNTLGMGLNTTQYRFSGYNFKEWEFEGIYHIIIKHFVDS